jgi:hypothetical protein
MTKSPKKERISMYLKPGIMKALSAHIRCHSSPRPASRPSFRLTLSGARRRLLPSGSTCLIGA